jgi:hypothetical protein
MVEKKDGPPIGVGDVLSITSKGKRRLGLVVGIIHKPIQSENGTWPWESPPEYAICVNNEVTGGSHSSSMFPARPGTEGKVLLAETPPEEVAILKNIRRMGYGTKAGYAEMKIEIVPKDRVPNGTIFSYNSRVK